MENKKLKTVEFILEDEMGNIIGDISAISIVSTPAIEVSAQLFNKQVPINFSNLNEEKQILTSAVLIPNKKILRIDEVGEYYNCFMSEKTIIKASQLFAKNGGFLYTTLEHQPEKIKDAYIFESWITGENDKAYDMGFSKDDIIPGTWMVSFKVESKELWEKIKMMKENSSELGFSIESIFAVNQKFAEIDTVIDTVIKNEAGEDPIIEDVVEEKEIPQKKSKKQLVKELIENITNSEEIDANERVRLISKLMENL